VHRTKASPRGEVAWQSHDGEVKMAAAILYGTACTSPLSQLTLPAPLQGSQGRTAVPNVVIARSAATWQSVLCAGSPLQQDCQKNGLPHPLRGLAMTELAVRFLHRNCLHTPLSQLTLTAPLQGSHGCTAAPTIVIATPPAGGVRSATERSSALSAKKERSDVAISGKFRPAMQLL